MINLNVAHRRVLLWILAVIITVFSAYYQRRTGPSKPLRGKVTIENSTVPFRLLRSEVVGRNAPVTVTVSDTTVKGIVRYRRYKSDDAWTTVPMQRQGDRLIMDLPHQPAAGKIMYFVLLEKDESVSLSGKAPVILRYRGDVPAVILLAHVLLIFMAMLLSNRTALEALDARGKAYVYMLWTIGLLVAGGFILGPIMQKYAFGALWTGFPFGTDLTDNKTLITLLGWLWAWFQNRKGRDQRGWIIFAGIILIAVYFIPHSLLGSELDYTKMP
jgi:hypothetical protein